MPAGKLMVYFKGKIQTGTVFDHHNSAHFFSTI